MAPSSSRHRRRLLLALLCLALVHGAGLYLFTLGFFLTRFEVSDVSSCPSPPSSGRHGSRLRQHVDVARSAAGGCWMPQRFRRVVFVIIDALRFDFVHAPASTASGASSFYLHHLPILNATLHARPAHSALFKFVADPPTMTMQRLKGLTTGSLPTFLDIKDNMASDSTITEDNLLHQMHAAKRPIVFMGDDTWQSLYASLFTRAYAFDSFNVKDLHSVDRGVERHLFPELQQDDWDLLIAHFLGVDHVGHTHGPSSPFMTEKLREMNAVLSRVLTEMPQEDTLLAVLGDHGMSADGNHGGASDEETGAALFLYSPTTKLLNADATQPKGSSWTNEVPQVDLVPTLSLLTGLPIPFGSLGAVIPQLFFHPREEPTAREDDLAALANLNDALRLNVEQVRRYLFTYSSASKLPESEYDQLERIYERIERLDRELDRLTTSKGDATIERPLREELAATQHAYVREALTLGRSIWTQFDLVGMAWGVLVLCLGLGMSVHGLAGHILEEPTLSRSTVVLALGVGIFGRFVPHLGVFPRAPVPRGVLFASLTLVMRYVLNIAPPSETLRASGKRLLNAPSLVAVLVVLLHVLALLSNSYIVAELQVLNFLTATVGFFALVQSQRRRPPSFAQRHVIGAVSFIAANRILRALERPNIIQSETSFHRTWIPLVAHFTIASIYCIKTGAQTGRKSAVLATLSVAWSTAASAMYWYFSPIETTVWRLWLPRSVYLLLVLSVVESCRHQRSTVIPMMPQLALSLCLVLGPTSPLIVALCGVMWHSLAPSVKASDSKQPWVLFLCIVTAQSFFLTGHECTFTSLQNAAGFVGFDTFHFYVAGALLGLNTFGSIALGLFHIPSVVGPTVASYRTPLTVVSYFSLQTLVSTVFVALQRRHLMVWAIFAPKYLFDGVMLLVVDLIVCLMVLHMDTPVEWNTIE
ncbi:hypothetical protein PINS_up007171 [Pythium insidiosum]|nr:hypothetical protein PINS_up007171 [Pythium insidiosum]